ncbi:MAG TPA: ABC transporter permease [Solirubrobacteraceae bacterium]|nr:ABC transporter permease [Solirubrobacteraceae bacterium]
MARRLTAATGLLRNPLARVLIGRVLAGVPVVFAAMTLSFMLVHLLPGDPVNAVLDPTSSPTPEQRENLRHQLGLDGSLPRQFADYAGRVAHGDLGHSIQSGRAVSTMIGDTIGPSLQLAGAALVLALIASCAISLIQVSTRHRPIRALATILPPASLAFPGYWVGIVLMSIFAFGLGWFPATGADGLSALVLPAVTLAIPATAFLTRVLSAGLQEALAQPYVLIARAKGATPRRVVLRHAFRNGLIPTITVAGLAISYLLAGAVITETVFARPGIGRTVVAAVSQHDIPVVQGFVMLFAVVFVVVNIVIDLLYVVADPRITTGRAALA